MVSDAYAAHYNAPPTADVLRFLKDELMQHIWLLLLDKKFMQAWLNGIVVLCGDGIRRRLFFRFFIYAADYPEKYVSGSLCPQSTLT